jgi:isopenicillin-N epimerase
LERRLEKQPVRFLQRELFGLLAEARECLGGYIHADPMDLALIPNATTGVNIVARSLPLEAGDEVVLTDHEYGACGNIFSFVCQKRGARVIWQEIPAPPRSSEEIVEAVWAGVTPRTRLIFLSHFTSPTAIQFPVEEICRRAREEGILTMIDGAHAPGQLPVDIRAIDPDFYTGNCHKWMLSPLGSAFLYTRADWQDLVEPLVVSWGWSGELGVTAGSRYLDNLQWWGTYDPTPVLTIPCAIQFMKAHDWGAVSTNCQRLLAGSLSRLVDSLGVRSVSFNGRPIRQQMAAIDLSPVSDVAGLKNHLYDRYQVEIPCYEWNNMALMRLSIQAYNSAEDVDRLIEGLDDGLFRDRSGAGFSR